ncbi:hypothetical protein FACS1894172_21810 [Spirochaetia bacterium]|nr:hypothetical protein FACS1894172_21810 [Spirochaetia bacterium]
MVYYDEYGDISNKTVLLLHGAGASEICKYINKIFSVEHVMFLHFAAGKHRPQ